jgi:hypothetical protein
MLEIAGKPKVGWAQCQIRRAFIAAAADRLRSAICCLTVSQRRPRMHAGCAGVFIEPRPGLPNPWAALNHGRAVELRQGLRTRTAGVL